MGVHLCPQRPSKTGHEHAHHTPQVQGRGRPSLREYPSRTQGCPDSHLEETLPLTIGYRWLRGETRSEAHQLELVR